MSWIDLREDIRGLIEGDPYGIPQGKWVVLRIMRIGEYSQYWNPQTKEAVGGPKWKYDDFVVRAIMRPGSTLAGRSATAPPLDSDVLSGLDLSSVSVYGIAFHPEFPRLPHIGDIIYEIDKYASVEKPRPPFTAIDRMFIRYSLKLSGDYGRTEAMLLVAERKQGDY